MEDKFPKFAYDLVDQLDAEVPAPEFPTTGLGWASLSEDKMRHLAFRAGMRATVDMLLGWRDSDGDDSDPGPEADHGDPFSRVFDDGSGEHKTVASVDVAARILAPVPSSDSDE